MHDDLFAAIKAGDLSRVSELLAAEPGLASARDASGLSAILTSAYYQQPAITAALLAAGPSLDVFEAAAAGATKQLSALLSANPAAANAVAADGFTPLGLAAFFGHTEAVYLLLDHQADPAIASQNAMQVMPLHSAVAGQHLAIAKALLIHGAPVNAAQADAFTPLHGAAQNGQLAMIDLLLKNGADPSAQAADGQTPRDIALAAGHSEATALL
jgi:ankyrin repeat protein